MELTPGIVLIVAVVVAAGFVLIRWGKRNEAAAPVEAPITPARNTAVAAGGGESRPLVDWLLERASEQTGMRLADDALVRERIAEAAMKAMEELRTSDSATVNLPFLAADPRGPKHFAIRFRRSPESRFEAIG